MNERVHRRFEAEIRAGLPRLDIACFLIAAQATAPAHATDADIDAVLRRGSDQLDELAATVSPHGSPADRLRGALGGFHGSQQDYLRLDSNLLDVVLTRRRGLPILLCTVWTEVARRCGIEAHGLGVPGQFLVGVPGIGSPTVLLDPFSGGQALPPAAVRALAARAGAPLAPHHLQPHPPGATVERMLGNIRNWAQASTRPDVMLWACDLGLLLRPDSTALHQQRAVALSATGRYLQAADAWLQVAVLATDAGAVAAAEHQSAAARARLN